MLYSVESAHALLKRYITSSQGDLLTTWLQIRQAVSSQIQNIKENAVKDRIRTPLHLSRAQYQDCFGYITNTALRLADTNYTSSVKPLKPCTGVFKVTTGLPCAHRIDDIRYAGDSLRPSDFHGHWHWDRYLDVLEPTLEPLRVVSYSASTLSRTHSTRRIPSGFEASETRERRCGLCRLPGHTRASLRCPVNMRNAISELGIDSTALTTVPISPVLHANSGVTGIVEAEVADIDTGSNAESTTIEVQPPSPASTSEAPATPAAPDTRPIWPGRPELLYKQYLAEKEAWLIAHPDVQPANYRTTRGLEVYSVRWCNENRRYLPRERINIETETELDEAPNWTYEEISAWLDNEALKEQEIEREVEAELIAAGGFGRQRGVGSLRKQIERNIAAEKGQYRFMPY
jgi:hypothetical protein